MTSRTWLTASLGVLAFFAVACKDKSPGGSTYEPDIPETWASGVTNAWFRLEPGTIWTYRTVTGEGTETNTVEVLAGTHTIEGVAATTVHDQVLLDGVLTEDTMDWFAQDAAGNVWYLGEDTKEYENGHVVGTEGSWEWGKDGALPGIIMWADPTGKVGQDYRQEYYEGEAEDWGKVFALNTSVQVPFGNFIDCLETEDWSGLESGREHKYYSPAAGNVVLEVDPGGTRSELIGLTRPTQ